MLMDWTNDRSDDEPSSPKRLRLSDTSVPADSSSGSGVELVEVEEPAPNTAQQEGVELGDNEDLVVTGDVGDVSIVNVSLPRLGFCRE
jgi:hypothetical protein